MTVLLHRTTQLTAAVLLVGALLLTGCDLLNVDNPNNLREEDLVDNPTAAGPMANGSEATVTRALAGILGPYSTASDELTWIGSRDAWNQLDQGNLDDNANEFSDNAYPYVTEARWSTDEYIRLVDRFRTEDQFADRYTGDRPLTRLYLYGSIMYTSIADIYDDFVVSSNREEAGPPVGSGNMSGLYDTAIEYATNGLQFARDNDFDDLEVALLAMRARAHYAKAVWAKLNPNVNTGSPLVNSAQAVADAEAALALMDPGYVFELEITPGTGDILVVDLSMPDQINGRAELGFGETYVSTNADGTFDSVTFQDPISGDVDPVLESYIEGYVAEGIYADIPVVSAAEMRLILAEAALAGNTSYDFATQINAVRGEGDKPDWTAGSGVSAQDILIHERRVNLFLQGRRLADHYRFDDSSPEWTVGPDDLAGTFFPIAITEVRANPNL